MHKIRKNRWNAERKYPQCHLFLFAGRACGGNVLVVYFAVSRQCLRGGDCGMKRRSEGCYEGGSV
ncbi:hypothetical protein BEI59_13190 [Eisenbergiella tayi]|uniref:Uncharacterized protein n=1 Tax=Eisenbergiella tayi TaxID=1432052 RepID=A0A1E3UI53_9FIRM|nr:hypothetical protein BEI62_25455 [Eisenbergiella tayi]ODR42821.1 hypothetical protein BEI60_02210 [Eisenbergiella tayi]ODR51859.1 hypothetical protein BEI59_13190 [Eisenbergiella tayi]ODR56576.1 hypothetical protein BEI63_13855 [Eisenbergiella tayi]ODR62216.1 hypothetical protein BEI64_05445 [Eisenbergiella tayi]